MHQEELELNKKKTHLLMLLMLAEADNEDHPLETLYIYKVAERLGISKEEVDDIDKNPQNLTFVIPKMEFERMEILYDLLFLMQFDQKVSKEEVELIHRLAFHMGFSPLMTAEMINTMTLSIGKQLPKDELLNIIRKYMN